ncbi:MAG: EF-Tu/IF-2/RF-3 family GTPase [Candidatus Thermoplasmatota archaeon]|nr:EF-Tu/IF-2/RF-3 family GTPase [Candidatus Thermoplasmatota archaeon]
MKTLTIFTYNAEEFLREVSKKGTSSDIEFHERKSDDSILTFISPLRYPDKISSLTDSIFPADIAVVNITSLNRELGEVIVALDLMGPDIGYITFSDQQMIDQVTPLLKGTRLSSYKITEQKPVELAEEISSLTSKKPVSPTTVIIDHFFGVKSVGTVALGFVLSGSVEKHQDLELSYLDRKVQVRSIQMHDVDVDSAGPGARVGLALKNADPEELERGMLLSEKPFQYASVIDAKIIPHRSVKRIPDGQVEVFVSDYMRYQRGFYDGKSLTMDKKVCLPGKSLVVSSPAIVPRIFGRINF